MYHNTACESDADEADADADVDVADVDEADADADVDVDATPPINTEQLLEALLKHRDGLQSNLVYAEIDENTDDSTLFRVFSP